VHPIFLLSGAKKGGGEVAWCHYISDFRVAFWEVCHEIHLFPAVLLLAIDAGKSESLERAAMHEVEAAIWIKSDVLSGR
jgi:hypothetical protein